MPSLILMDIELPEMDGITAATILRQDEATKDIKIIAVTAYATDIDRMRILSSKQFDGFIEKPVKYDKLIDTIKTILGG